ncbi:MAG: hypothetical protein A3F31_00560 [Candidatus Levybacteria bacterium RIFCSPHIGHO2_12_FULL_38_12]|nr:MAG: hypothetical protein A2770_02855 [Candidatus Levybacteria bacterium RIFCSPHIGHO2_01_FULL_38_12]OGH22757.1 MAG: hypothetical protein A3F31_00560 [Candidatus Levybacteria bacterium RIFCSPHIGHO2_12_FULL_38_12]OGH45010.1 MAG: hypothetical protein A3J14_03995 [Candidatus Levybacteria bacterium RIFCSPLOWO2_02_FULL_37_18]
MKFIKRAITKKGVITTLLFLTVCYMLVAYAFPKINIFNQEKTISQDQAIAIVRNLSEVKNFFETSPERHTETSRYKPMIVVEWEKDNYWQVWVYEWVYDSERYDDNKGVSHTATFNRYIVDKTGKIKCSFFIYEGTKLIRVGSEKEYPCN